MDIIIEQGEINDGNIVLPKPLSLPEGTKVRIQIEPILDTDDKDAKIDIEKEEFSKLPCFGMWADREDVRDSVAWVRKLRERGLERLTRAE